MDDMEHEIGSCGNNADMDFENMFNFDIEMEGDDLSAKGFDVHNDKTVCYYPQVADEFTPKLGQQFQTLDDVHTFYNSYAMHAGFSVRKWTEKKKVGSVEICRKEYVCYKQGKGKLLVDAVVKRKRGSRKEGCSARIVVVKRNDLYVISIVEEGHCHPLSTPHKRHLLPSHRNVSTAQKSLSQQLGLVNIPQSQQYKFLAVQAGGFENIGCTQRDLYNFQRDKRNELKGHDGDILNEYLKLEQQKNPSFSFTIDTDDEKRITRYFWADATSRRAYRFYGDVVIFDTTYNTNRYGMIFAPIMGVNNHGQTTLFACAFLSDETIDSFVWFFKCFLDAMPGDAPQMIITDQDPAMTNAISQILPNTLHRYCSWHILTKFSEKIDSVKFSAYYKEFSECIWNSETVEEFGSTWVVLLEKSGLNANKWLQSMYDIRSKWVPAHVNHVFSAGMSSSQRAESSHSFFKRFVSKRNSLVDFMIQLGRGIQHQRHKELVSDNKDLIERPKMKIAHDFLFQMVDTYTHSIYYKFEDELCDSLNYRFELMAEDVNYNVYKIYRKNVSKFKVREIHYDKSLDYAKCTCKKFESSGILCRHVIAYLNKYHDLDKLPTKYILNRWTKTAKSSGVIDDNGVAIKEGTSYLLLRSQLIQHSLDLIDRALTNEEATNVFKESLRSVDEKINQIIDKNGSERNNEMDCGGNNVSKSVNKSCTYEHSYIEPNQVRSKGCGKRLKGGKERALGKIKNSKARRCHGCGKVGVTHDKRNCPVLNNRTGASNDDGTKDPSSDDDTDPPTEWPSELE